MLLTRTNHITVLPEEAAGIFASFDSTEQVEFFNALARYIHENYQNQDGSFAMQMQYVTDEDLLTNDARYIMAIIGEYASQQPPHIDNLL
jgi:hypothetical protein